MTRSTPGWLGRRRSARTQDVPVSTFPAAKRLSGMANPAPEEILSSSELAAGGWRPATNESSDSEVVTALFRQHYAALLRLGVVMLGSREAAEDAVQDAFVALHRKGPTMQGPEAAEAYLRSAVLNRSRSWVRRQVTQRAPRPLMLVREHHESPEDTAVSREQSKSLVTLMRTLARRQREVLACRYVLELSIAETAELLNISDGSVKAHTHRGLQALQKRIEVDR
jgi:RNA polymerase sigma factor (sigma-70 family)